MASKKRREKGRRRKDVHQKRKRIRIFALGTVIMLAAVFGGVYLTLKNYVERTGKGVICDNVFIGGMEVSGMTEAEAREALQTQKKDDAARNVTLKLREHDIVALLDELGYDSPDIDKLAKKAVDYGKKGSIWKRYQQMKKLEEESYVLKEKYTVKKKAVAAVLEEKAKPLLQGPENAYITRNEDGSSNIVEEKEGETIDERAMVKNLSDYLNGKWQHGDFSMELAVIREKPEIIKADLEEIGDILGSYSTNAGGGARWTNLKTGVEKLNGTILKPGEELSVYGATAPYDEAHGYVQGTAYENGQVVPSYGGGICQVSTTLYNAVIYAELEIVERHPHSMAVDYVDPSRDAAIAGGVMDFRFKNPYAKPIYIFGEIDAANRLRVVIYGKETRPESREIEFESETLSTEEYGVTYKATPKRSFGEMAYTGSPHTGREARLWKVVYENGTQTSRDIFNTSTYAKSDQIVEVGTAGGSAEAIRALETAIASQDKDAINAAIQSGNNGGGQQAEEGTGTETGTETGTGQ